MKYTIIDNTTNDVLFKTDKKEEIDIFIEINCECSQFLGFFWEDLENVNRMIINTSNYNVVIEY